MFLPIILLVLFQLVSARRFPVTEYTQVARTLDGSPCLTGCVNNQCVTNWFGVTAPCHTYGPAPKYFTTQKRHPFAVHCLTNCGFFGYRREWCITSYDMHWDYCSSYVREGPEDPVAMTRYGDNCVSECTKQGKNFYWCWHLKHNGRRAWEFCAPAAEPVLPQVPILPADYNIGAMNKQSCDHFIRTEYSCVSTTSTAIDCRDNLVSSIAANFEARNLATDCMKPVNSYSTVQFQGMSVPAVIRARITNESTYNIQYYQTIPSQVDSKYRTLVPGYNIDYLIGSGIGGPYADYNFIPRSSNWQPDEWSDLEGAMGSWCRRTGGYVDMAMVIFYTNGNTALPRAIGVSMSFRNADGSLYIDCRDKLFWN